MIDTYAEHGRIMSGDREQMLDSLYAAWLDDVRIGKRSLVIAASGLTTSSSTTSPTRSPTPTDARHYALPRPDQLRIAVLVGW